MIFTSIFLAFLVLGLFTQFYLAQRQVQSALKHRHAVPKGFELLVSLESHQKAADYTVAKLRFGLLENIVSKVLLIALTVLGLIYFIHLELLAYFAPGVWQQIALLLGLSILTSILDLPFSWYKQFRLEEQFSFNRMSQKIFWIDFFKQSKAVFSNG